MTITKQRLTCECGHVFDAEVVMHCPIDVWVASVKVLRCPKCGSGADKLFFGGAHADPPPTTASIEERAAWWLERGDTGTSSLTIYCAFTGGRSPHREFNYPIDPDDFSRCKALLDLIPEWRADLGKVVERFPWFEPFIERWDRFEALYAEEKAAALSAGNQLYDEMQAAAKEADRMRRARSAKE